MSVWTAWEVREHAGVTTWLAVRLDLPGGGWVDALAVVAGGCVGIEEVRAQPPLSLDDLAVLADWIEEPLLAACGMTADLAPVPAGASAPEASPEPGRRPVAEEGPRPPGVSLPEGASAPGEGPLPVGTPVAGGEADTWTRGADGARRIAEEYLAAQRQGADPVSAVMCATGRSRRQSLKLIGGARDAGYLTPRHARR
ncbi:DUF6214 family protein [Streptomyces sp. NPDC047022]|uniref:DUF6214 family protein n=1 Tax=Streptomyces sp. NPDC047022 TaxID=3155737 RepID=UPI0033F968B8